MNADELKAHAAVNIDDVIPRLFPLARKVRSEWKMGDLEGSPGDSLSINAGLKRGVWKDFASGEDGGDNLVDLVMKAKGVDFAEACEILAGHLGVQFERQRPDGSPAHQNGAAVPSRSEAREEPAPRRERPPVRESPEAKTLPEYPWAEAVERVDDAALAKLSESRGLSPEFVQWLKDRRHVGVVEVKGHGLAIAFPVHDNAGRVVAAHVRMPNKKDAATGAIKKVWSYLFDGDDGPGTQPLVIGDLARAKTWHVLESQWDAFGVMDALQVHAREGWESDIGFFITRGASNGRLLSRIADDVREFILWPQNDAPKANGKTPSEEWFAACKEAAGKCVTLRAETPAHFEDPDAWLRTLPRVNGTVHRDVLRAIDRAKGVADFYTPRDLWNFDTKNDPNCLLGDRWLCRGASCLWVGTSGIGKSTIALQAMIYWGAGLPFFGVTPKFPLKSMMVQAENDEGDIAEMVQGVVTGLVASGAWKTAEEVLEIIEKMVVIIRDFSHVGERFVQAVEKNAAFHKPDLVWMDPALSFVGDNMSDQAVISAFFRTLMNPVAVRLGFVMMVLHHTGKPVAPDRRAGPTIDEMLMYLGLGSSDLVNWARCVNVLMPIGEGRFRLTFAKRGRRAQALDTELQITTQVYLRHGAQGLFWEQIEKPAEPEKTARDSRGGNGPTATQALPMEPPGSAVRRAMAKLAPFFKERCAWRMTALQEQALKSGIKEKTFEEWWKKLKKAGVIVPSAQDARFFEPCPHWGVDLDIYPRPPEPEEIEEAGQDGAVSDETPEN